MRELRRFFGTTGSAGLVRVSSGTPYLVVEFFIPDVCTYRLYRYMYVAVCMRCMKVMYTVYSTPIIHQVYTSLYNMPVVS